MAGFNLGSLLAGAVPSIGKGIQHGLQYGVDWVRYDLHALATGDKQAQEDLNAIKAEWLKEVADETGAVRGDVVRAIENGADPFQKSRKMLQAYEAKHGKP